MKETIRIGIAGYGNLGRGVEKALGQNPDMSLAAVFTRRRPDSLSILTPGVPVVSLDEIEAWKEKIDVLILCGGSATDLPAQGPALARHFHTVDSFDTHPKIPEYFEAMDEAARAGGHLALFSVGWDPGLFSLNRLYGEAILPQARTVRGVPLSIPWKGKMEVQGECIMRLSALEKYNQTAEEPLKNARNAAAGGLRNLDPAVTAARNLSAFFYQVGTIENPPYADQPGMVRFLREQGFPVSPYFETASDREGVFSLIDEIEAQRDSLDFLIDGAVIKIMDMQTRALMGYTDKFPRWAVAYKFPAEESTATLERVTWELGRTGKLTPLGHVSPVDFAGVTVKKATLNNYGDIQRKKLTLGCTVWIRRSNDVIPEITGRVEDGAAGAPILPPQRCPACGGPLTQRGANLYCLNRESCKPQAVARLAHFASRDAMDITGFSEKTAELFYDQLGLRDPAGLYRLTLEQLLSLEGFQEKKARNLLDALEASKHCALSRFLLAVGIPNIGRRTARDLSAAFGSLEGLQKATLEQLLAVDEIGEIVAQSILDFFSFPENQRMIARLLEAGVSPQAESASTGGAFSGLTLVVTGTLPTLSRQEAEAFIRRHGGTAASSVSRKTSYVVAGEKAGGKLDKALTLGVPVLTEQELLQMAQNG